MAFVACGGQDSDPTVIIAPAGTFAPTESSSPTATSSHIRPLTLQAWLTPSVVSVGETVKVHTDSAGAGIPQYTLSVNGIVVSIIKWDGAFVQGNSSNIAEVASWESGPSSAEWHLKIHEPGDHLVTISVTGEVGAAPTGPFYFTSGSQQFQFKVTAAN